ncbi:hypothetical protein HK413_11450 [Mucilaginibacter sp. S1162]|uniref:Uncharacterized protein n=1 Tax=Mucilaginibacter humi TaxID=2732510 RepID=A0ABX1W2U9_9SPHI|nr:hypothetical protein [Mucilaginibacter humi]NNU34556.1 hypothetical protein [Mucilaginibacter humi]
MPRKGCYFFLDEKVTKKSSHPGGFSAAQALCAAKPAKPRARSFCRPLSRRARASGKITNARTAAQAHLFYRLSPEAARMTIRKEPTFSYICKMKKKRKGLSARRAGSMALRVEVIGLT